MRILIFTKSLAVICLSSLLLPSSATAAAAPDETISAEALARIEHIAESMPLPRISPQPASVTGVAAPVLSLNGVWKFSRDVSRDGPATGDSPDINVPGEWAMQGFEVPSGAFAEYWRTVDIPADWAGKVVRLRFDAVHAVCHVFVNGQKIGGHEGGFVPFELDATSCIKPGGTNDVRVQVQSESLADHIACMSQYAAHQVGGILRKATLFALPRANIASQSWAVTFDEHYKDATLVIDTVIDVAGASSASADGSDRIDRVDVSDVSDVTGASGAPDAHAAAQFAAATLRHELFSPGGKLVATGTSAGTAGTSTGTGGGAARQCVIAVSAPLHWTSETPALYTLKSTLLAGGAPAQTITRRIGFRQMEIRGNVYHINGRPVKLLGVNRHEIHPLTGRAITPELCREDALLLRAANCNFIRTSHYPPSEEFLDACDELGLFVESEAAVVWIKHRASPVWKERDHLAPEVFELLLRANLDNIAANRAHPCVIQWSLANESLWTPLFDKVNKAIKPRDPTRTTVFHDQHWGKHNNAGSTADVANHHYPDEENPDTWSAGARPIVFGEFAHVQCYNHRELQTDPFIREDWGRVTARMVDLMWAQPGIMGGTIWSGIDEVFHMPGGSLRGYGHWGVIDGWRRKKPEWHGTKQAFAPVKLLHAGEPRVVTGGTLVLQVQNRFNFTNLKDVKIAWDTGSKKGTVTADIEPHAKGEIKIPVPGGAAGAVEITVTDKRGVECMRERVAFTPGGSPPPAARPSPAAPAVLIARENQFAARSTDRSKVFQFDTTTGNFSVEFDGVDIIENSPVALMVLRLDGTGSVQSPAGARVVTNKIEPLTPVCKNWKLASVKAESGDGKVIVTVRGDYDEAAGQTRFIIDGDGVMEVRYAFTMKQKINPRQWGLVFTLPRSFDTLAWESRGTWSTAAADSIGRARGVAKANPVAREDIEELGRDMRGEPWAAGANKLGTNDFRSTKARIRNASLGDGRAVFAVEPAAGADEDGASVRAWVEGDSVRMLVAGFNTGGYDSFFNRHYAKERRPLNPGDTIEGSFLIRIGR